MAEQAKPPRVPVATYRLQLTPAFTFHDAARAVPWIASLGVSHLYLSPIFAAVPGSEHGYDVVDHNRINSELGGVAGLYELERAARDHGLGILLDIVPNHVGIDGGANPWWRDVMRHGKDAAHAPYFDIDWEGQAYLPAGILVYPTLGRPFGEALEAGELTLALERGEIVVRYFERSFPIAPHTYPMVIGMPPVGLPTNDASAPGRLAELVDALAHSEGLDASLRFHELHQLAEREPAIRDYVAGEVDELNGVPGNAASWDRLDQLLAAQPYRLAYWRVSAEEINYRRFFDINELAAIRVEYQPVFDEVHRLVREFAEHGLCDGLRVDHVDGLYDPQAYLDRLDGVLNGPGTRAPRQRARPIYVEKVLAWDEHLPAHWRTAGTTGYDALARFDRVFIDPSGEQPLTAIYHEFTEQRARFEDVAFGARRRTAERTFAGEINVLAAHLHRLAQSNRRTRDITLRAHRDAIAALLASLPVYRTYLEDGHVRPEDAQTLEAAASDALARDPNAGEGAMDFLLEVLQLRGIDNRPEERERRLHFRRRLQQLSGPVMAKGVEDTAFFRYNRLLSLNEVGSDPARFSASLDDLHAWFANRARTWPHAMSATTTHDTKRSEDARMRLHVLSEIAREWRVEVRAWRRMNARSVQPIAGQPAPDANLEYYYYQSLVAAWEGTPTPAFRDRMHDHMLKAMREAKLQTSWTRVNEAYEEAVLAFVRATLAPRRSRRFIERVNRFSARIAGAAKSNSMAMLTLKTMAPGVPDFYQGSEAFLTTLTDPDNRRPVDFHAVEAGAEANPKLVLMRDLLAVRSRHHALFSDGDYIPLATTGPMARHVFAFERRRGAERVVVALPRLVAGWAGEEGRVGASAWEETFVQAEEQPGGAWRDALNGRVLESRPALPVCEMLAASHSCVLEWVSA